MGRQGTAGPHDSQHSGDRRGLLRPDNLHVIAQTKDPAAAQPEKGKVGGSLTFTYTDTGEELTRINDKGQDACSWFFPDGKRLIWTSTRDNLDMPPGNWSDETDYPAGRRAVHLRPARAATSSA